MIDQPCECPGPGECPRFGKFMGTAAHRLCRDRPAYRKVLAAPPIEATDERTLLSPDELPCILRGPVVRQERCRLEQCVGGPMFDVFACDLHGECSIQNRAVKGLKDCKRCEGRMPEGPPPGPRRVVFFTPGMLGGGAERWIVTLAKSWKTDVVATGVVLADWGGSEPSLVEELVRCGVQVHGGSKVPRDAANAPQVVRHTSLAEATTAALHNADVVISWGWGDVHRVLSDAGWQGPHIVVSHGSCDWSKRLLDGPSQAATHLVAVSEAAARSFPPDERDRVKVLWNGIEVDRVVPSRDRDAVRASWGCGPRELLVGYLGRHAMSKRPEAIAEAVAELNRRGYRAKGVWIGAGTHTAILKRTCEDIAPGACVWVDPPDHVGDALCALDCLVLASQSEGMSLALCEAWAAGVPTVATPVGAVPELERQFGPLTRRVPVGATPVELADAVESAMARGLVRHAREVTLREFTAARMARRWADWLVALSR